MASALWAPSNLAIICFFLTKMLPKTSLFQIWALRVNLLTAPTWLSSIPAQDSLTIAGKSLWLNHMGWNLKGRFAEETKFGHSLSKSGQWLELTLARWVTFASGKEVFQSGLAQTLSSLHCISPPKSLLLVQVNYLIWMSLLGRVLFSFILFIFE